MAVRDNLTGDAWSVQQWSEGLEAAVLDKIHYLNFIGNDSTALIQKKDELIKDAGDTVKYFLRYQDTAAPLGSSDSFESNERSIVTADDSFVIDEIGTPYRWKTRMSRQRVQYEDRTEATAAISDNLANALDQAAMLHLTGYVPTSGTTYGLTMTGNNAVVAPDSSHHIWAGSGNTADENLATNDNFTLDLISRAALLARSTVEPRIRPAQIDGLGAKYVCFISPRQKWQLQAQDSRWDKVQMALLQGGYIDKNPLLNGALGVWDDVLIVESNRMPAGVNSSSGASIAGVQRASLAGAQSLVIGWGRTGGSPGSFIWEEERYDYGRQRGIAGSCLVGIKSPIFTKPGGSASRFASIVISSDSPVVS